MATERINGANQEFTVAADGWTLAQGSTNKRSLQVTGGDAIIGGNNLRTTDSPTFANITDSGLTASKPVFSDGSKVLTSSGTVPVDLGGTGQTSYTDGQLLIGKTAGNTLEKATITAGNGISITNGSGTITVALSGGVAWDVTPKTTDFNAAVNVGYYCNLNTGGVPLVATLPATAAVGDTIGLRGMGTERYKALAAAGDTIQVLSKITKAAGYIEAVEQFSEVILVCEVANSSWVAYTPNNFDVEVS